MESVPGFGDRLEKAGFVAEGLTQRPCVPRDRSLRDEAPSPDVFQQLVLGDQAPVSDAETHEKIERPRSDRDGLGTAKQQAFRPIEDEPLTDRPSGTSSSGRQLHTGILTDGDTRREARRGCVEMDGSQARMPSVSVR